MNRAQLLGLVRHLLTAAGGGLSANGLASQDEVQQIIGGLVALAGVIWSYLEKRSRDAAASANSAPPRDTLPLPAFLLPLALTASLLPLTLTPGCGTMGGGSGTGPEPVTPAPAPSGPITPARIQKIARLAVWTTTTGLVINRPDRLVAFQKAQLAINKLVAEQTWDVAALSKALTSTGEKEFTGSEGRLIMAGTALLIDTIAGESVDLRNVENIRAVILGAQAGLNLALGER